MIEFVNIVKKYDHNVTAIDNVNMKIDKGEFVFLVGPSGSGKSTFLRLLIKEDEPTSGKILVDGKDITKLKKKEIPYLRRKIGFVFQDFRLLYDRTVEENIIFALNCYSENIKIKEKNRTKKIENNILYTLMTFLFHVKIMSN